MSAMEIKEQLSWLKQIIMKIQSNLALLLTGIELLKNEHK
jgi:hypothetical protein